MSMLVGMGCMVAIIMVLFAMLCLIVLCGPFGERNN